MAVCSTTTFCKYLTRVLNFGQPLREKAIGTTRGHAKGETLTTSGPYRRPLFKSGLSVRRLVDQAHEPVEVWSWPHHDVPIIRQNIAVIALDLLQSWGRAEKAPWPGPDQAAIPNR